MMQQYLFFVQYCETSTVQWIPEYLDHLVQTLHLKHCLLNNTPVKLWWISHFLICLHSINSKLVCQCGRSIVHHNTLLVSKDNERHPSVESHTIQIFTSPIYILFEEVTQRLWKMQTIHIIRLSLRTTSLCELCAKKIMYTLCFATWTN